MTWFGTVLSEDQHEVVELAATLVDSLPPLESAEGEDGAAVAQARASFVESGLWSIGIDDAVGGGGAPFPLRQAAFVALGGALPAVTWASVQTHAAAIVLASAGTAEMLHAMVSGDLPVAIIEADSIGIDIALATDRATGHVARVDCGGDRAALVVLDGPGRAWVIAPDGVQLSDRLACSGFAGARTSSATIDATTKDVLRIDDVDTNAVRTVLRTGAAAIAAGIAVSAAKAAVGYAHSRVQFGGPLTALPTVRSALATQISRTTALAEAAVTADIPSATRAAAAHVLAVDAAIDVAGATVQIHGGYGYLREYGVERLVRDAVSLRAASGADRSARELADDNAPARATGL